ncbi:MAG: hypothetical protein AAFW76_07655 [Pseudomonadota bacterium]
MSRPRGLSIAVGIWVLLAMFGPIERAAAQQPTQPDAIYIIYDSSNSMWGELPDGSRKYEAARTALRALVEEDFGGRDLALRMYGHSRADDCSDSALVVPFGEPSAVRRPVVEAMEATRPTGRTPIDRSLRAALDDFGDRNGSIILISDGIESCDADPCALVREWQDRDISISVHVVGLGLQGKDREAMQCIAEAAGTEYRDAFSADELIAGITAVVAAEPPPPADPEPVVQDAPPAFVLVVTTADGAEQKGAGTLLPRASGGLAMSVATHSRHVTGPGVYSLTAGVLTLDGSIYRPISQPVEVAPTGETVVAVEAPIPPRVSAKFMMDGADVRSSHVSVYRDGLEVGGFNDGGPAFVGEGVYEFRATIADSTQEISITESFSHGDDKVLTFEAEVEVRLTVNVTAQSTGEKLNGYPTTELWQDDVLVFEINNASGGLVRPGDYRVRLDDQLNRFEAPLTVSDQPIQTAEYRARTAAVTVRYLAVDGSPMPPKRVFVQRTTDRSRVTRYSDEPFAVTPGAFVIVGWPASDGYADTPIEAQAGDELEITLQAAN